MKKIVRILLVGDRDVGKTTLIFALTRESYLPEVPPMSDHVIVPPNVTPENVRVQIFDSSLRVQQEGEVDTEIQKADVVVLVYAVDNPESLARVTSHWLPTIRRARAAGGISELSPVILVGNKTDTKKAPASDLENQIKPIMNKFREVETCVECSAKTTTNISEVFYYAQKAVLYPTAILYDTGAKKMRPQAVAALTRVFKLCDTDKDGLLSDAELCAFQVLCFKVDLSQSEIAGVKEVCRESVTGGIRDDSMTLEGFLFLHTLFIERGKHETTWTILRCHGYDDDLSLKADFLHPPLRVGGDCSTEISSAGEEFLHHLFDRFAGGSEGVLTSRALEELFSTAPCNPWESMLPIELTGDACAMTWGQFHALWSLMAYDDYEKAMEYFAHLGFCTYTEPDLAGPSVASAIRVTRSRRVNRTAGTTDQRVFCCFLFGQHGSGKTTLLKALGERNGANTYSTESGQRKAVGFAGDKLLLVKEFAVQGTDLDVLQSPTCADQCDVAVFAYSQNDPSAFQYVAELQSSMFTAPGPLVLFVSTKSDLPLVEQVYDELPAAFCAARGIPALSAVSAEKPATLDQLFARLADMAQHPKSMRKGEPVDTRVWQALTIMGTVGVVGLVAYLVYKRTKRQP